MKRRKRREAGKQTDIGGVGMGGGGGTETETDTTDDRDSLIRHDQINRPEVHLVWNLELLVGFYRVESAAVCVYSAFGLSGGGGAGGGGRGE